jgi:hypothetical protein
MVSFRERQINKRFHFIYGELFYFVSYYNILSGNTKPVTENFSSYKKVYYVFGS